MAEYAERRKWIKKLRVFMDGPNAGTCPVCHTNPERAIEEHRREVERLTGALRLIAGQDNTRRRDLEGEPYVVIDADDKMRTIARQALEAYPEHALANKE